MPKKSNTTLKAAVVATLVAGLFAATAEGAPDNADNIADILHPEIHGKLTANNNANGPTLHGVAANPGQSDNDPRDGRPGFADQLNGTLHGGIEYKNKVADGELGGPLT